MTQVWVVTVNNEPISVRRSHRKAEEDRVNHAAKYGLIAGQRYAINDAVLTIYSGDIVPVQIRVTPLKLEG
jgi:hypothetical protein